MSIPKKLAWSVLAAITLPVFLLSGCASSPKRPTPANTSIPESNEPDLVAQLRARMAAGKIQHQQKSQEAKPVAARADTSNAPTVNNVDLAKQQAAMAVGSDYARALGMLKAGNDNEAMALLRKIGEKTPQFSGPLVNQGVILLKQQKFADAEKVLRSALTINPQNPYASNLLGIAQREQGKFAEARTAYETALTLDPNYAKAHFNLGVLADLYLQDLPLALSHYERYQALQSKPDPAVANWIIDLQKRTGVYKPPPPPLALPPAQEAPAEAATASSEQPAQSAAPATGATPAPAASPAPAPDAVKPADAPNENKPAAPAAPAQERAAS